MCALNAVPVLIFRFGKAFHDDPFSVTVDGLFSLSHSQWRTVETVSCRVRAFLGGTFESSGVKINRKFELKLKLNTPVKRTLAKDAPKWGRWPRLSNVLVLLMVTSLLNNCISKVGPHPMGHPFFPMFN